MSYTAEKMYELLPAVYRVRDEAQGGVLRQLIGVMAEQGLAVENDIEQLYDNWFIETCEEWVVPYLGDLLGVRGIHDLADAGFSQRARVANTLLYRQRKGTASVLEQLSHDATGWPAKVVEFFQLVSTTQHLNHVRKGVGTANLRRANDLDLLNTAFDSTSHTAEVRTVASGRGKYNIPNIGIYLWRLQSFFVQRSSAVAVAGPADGRYFVHPVGIDTPLYARAQSATAAGVPGRISRRALYADVEAIRQAAVDAREYQSLYFGAIPVLRIWIGGKEVSPAEIAVCHLGDSVSGWNRPPAQKTYKLANSGTLVPRKIQIGVDPVLGRIALPDGVPAAEVQVSSAYGFSGDVGAGPYNRQESVARAFTHRISWQIGVTKNVALRSSAPDPNSLVASVSEAVLAWKLYASTHPDTAGMITVLDSDRYLESLTGSNKIEIPSGCSLALVAADWPLQDAQRITGEYVAAGQRPYVKGDIEVAGLPGKTPGELLVNGLMLDGSIRVVAGNLGLLKVHNCTLVPPASGASDRGNIVAPTGNDNLSVQLRRSTMWAIQLADTCAAVSVADSIVGPVTAKGADAEFESVTCLGTASIRSLTASNSIFTQQVTSMRRQIGCMRFSYVPSGSITPKRYRCQPDQALRNEANPANYPIVRTRITPSFTATAFGDPAYCQLSVNCAVEIRKGAEDGSEMGSFRYLKQPQREVNLRSSLDEYLRFGLEPGIIFVT